MLETKMPINTFIVGAGLTGLTVANRLRENGISVMIAEKSKSVGGRMATRRSDTATFDHGAQFYRLKKPIENLHLRWSEKSLVTRWFDARDVTHFNCAKGMTALAKDLAVGLELKLEERVLQLVPRPVGWSICCESGREYISERVILAAPLPQSLEILKNSSVTYDTALDDILFAKAIVALIEVKSAGHGYAGDLGYREVATGPIFSIADQKAKGVSKTQSCTVTLKPVPSEALFDLTDEALVETILAELKSLDVRFEAEAKSVQIKKWRYSHPLGRATSLFLMPAQGLYLAGDAFGGPSLNGAVASANALADELTNTLLRWRN